METQPPTPPPGVPTQISQPETDGAIINSQTLSATPSSSDAGAQPLSKTESSPLAPEGSPSLPETAEELRARLTTEWDRQAARINAAVADGTIPADHPFIKEWNLLQDAKKRGAFDEKSQSFTVDGVDTEGKAIKILKNERESIDAFFDAASKLPEDEQGKKDIVSLRAHTKVYLVGKTEPVSYSDWEIAGKQPPAEKFDIEAKGPGIESPTEKTPEEIKKDALALAEQEREGAVILRNVQNGEILIDPDNLQRNDALVKQIFKYAYPNEDFSNLEKISPLQLLKNRLMHNVRYQQAFVKVLQVHPELETEYRNNSSAYLELERITQENSLITNYMEGLGEKIDLTSIDAEFQGNGKLALYDQQKGLIDSIEMIKREQSSLDKQNEKVEDNKLFKVNLGKRELQFTKSGLWKTSKNFAMMAGIAMFLLEQDAENQTNDSRRMGMH